MFIIHPMHEREASSLDQGCEIRPGRGEISPGCRYGDPDNVDWSGWMRSLPPLLTASPSRETGNAGPRSTCCIPDARHVATNF